MASWFSLTATRERRRIYPIPSHIRSLMREADQSYLVNSIGMVIERMGKDNAVNVRTSTSGYLQVEEADQIALDNAVAKAIDGDRSWSYIRLQSAIYHVSFLVVVPIAGSDIVDLSRPAAAIHVLNGVPRRRMPSCV